MSNRYRQSSNNQPVKRPPNPQVWEIWLATVPFDDEYQEKTRPVVIVNISSPYVGVLSMTSRAPKYSDEICLYDWQKAGLKKQSTVKMGRTDGLTPDKFIHKIGDLSLADITRIRNYKSRSSRPRSVQKSGCYIATSVYGSYDCPPVWVLRRYRDHLLSKTWYGCAFIKTYYYISPTLVKLLGKTKWFNRFCKSILDKIVNKLKKKDWQDSPYND